MKDFWRDLAVCLMLGICGSEIAAADEPSAVASSKYANILVGIHYFGGWWEPATADLTANHGMTRPAVQVDDSKWFDLVDGHDWRTNFPERVPTLGVDNNEVTMTKEIAVAADHGIDYFAILWFPRVSPAPMTHVSTLLNRSVSDFIHSPNAGRMKFYVEVCNGGGFDDYSDAQWDSWIPEWIDAMKSPSYLRVGGRLVFVIHNATAFYSDNCHGDAATIQRRLAALRQKVREAGLGDLVFGGGNLGLVRNGAWGAHVFDFSTNYMDVPNLPVIAKPYPYSQLADFVAADRQSHEKDVIPYLPYLAAGWDASPWHGEQHPSFLFPARNEWIATLRHVADALEKSENLGIPKPDGTVQKSFLIYAWNEFGEGGIMAPRVGEGVMKLEGSESVFGVKWGKSPGTAK